MKTKTTGMMDIKQGFFMLFIFLRFVGYTFSWFVFFSSDFWIIFMICVFSLFHRIKYLMISLHTTMNYSLMYAAYMREDCGVIVYWEKKICCKSCTFYEFKAQMRSLLEQNFSLFGFLCCVFCFVKSEFHS